MIFRYELADDVVTAMCETYGRAEDSRLTTDEFAEETIKGFIRDVYQAWSVHQVVKVATEDAREQAKVDAAIVVVAVDDKGEPKPDKDIASVEIAEEVIDIKEEGIK